MSISPDGKHFKPDKGSSPEELAWWKEDASRLNIMANLARKKGVTVPSRVTPQINPDGTMKGVEKDEEGEDQDQDQDQDQD